MIPQFLIIIFYLAASSCHAMEPEERINPAKMALAKKHGLIGYTIKQIGITYNKDGSVCNSPYDGLITDRIIKYTKYAVAQNLKFETIIPNPFTMYGIPKPGDTTLSYIDFIRNKFYLSMAHNPCKPELAAGLREKIVIWDLQKNKHAYSLTTPTLQQNGPSHVKPGIEHLAYNPQGTQLASVSNVDYKIHIWDLTTQNIILSEKLTDSIYQLLFNHDGTKLIIGTYFKFVIWDIKTNTYQLKTVQTIPTGTVCSPDGRTIASSINTDITLWNLESELNETTPAEHSLNSLAFNDNGTQLVSASNYTFTERFNRSKKELQPPLTLDNDTISQIIYCSKLNKYFILTTKNSIISIDPDNFIIDNEQQLMPTARGEQVHQSRFNKDGSKLTQIISVSMPETSHIKYYDLTPDLSSYTIEQLLAMQQQQKTSLNN